MYFTEVLREETDKEIIEPKNWVCEMYGYMLASADNKLVHHYPPNFSAAPPFDVSMTYRFFFFPISLLPFLIPFSLSYLEKMIQLQSFIMPMRSIILARDSILIKNCSLLTCPTLDPTLLLLK